MLSATAMGQAERRLEKSAVIDAPVAEVWKAWTTAEGLQSFMCQKATVDLKLNGRFEIEFSTDPPIGRHGSEGCKVLSYIPEKMLSFTWNAPPDQPVMRLRHTFVVLQFTPQGDKTRIDLSQGGWGTGPESDKTYAYFDEAWPVVLSWCQQRFKSGPIVRPASGKVSPPPDLSAMDQIGRLVGGVWRGEVKSPDGKPVIIEFKYRRHQDGNGIIGEGWIGKGRKDGVRVNSMFGLDPETKSVYYLDNHGSGTVYWGHVTMEGKDVAFVFGPAGGDMNAFTSRSRFLDNDSLASIIRNSKGEEVVGLTLKRVK
ncbi:hypothetical protein OP10G_2386 [Fimbriimonas ginsengisoli Gsoil 348]|uniref:Activator of Hsp90 ATPase homologue 1/2-like C-terminal domain-containing protein n=1 Tax=Fimbriimonas ginsengisoli Gsoil 348 TaxID=661478 RepID=A0A068NVW7_FIMGI|nr:hypothetical protein OP10G_2386 [Fimbriimonas ginsengisoli Gsoil 348]